MYEAVIFDLDGVLCSTDEFHYLAWKKLADRLHIPFDRADNRRQRGVSRMESLEILLEKSDVSYSEEQKRELAAEKNAEYVRLLQNLSEADLSDEVRQTLNALRAMGLKLAVGSSSRNTRTILEKIGLGGFFDAVADGNDIRHSKPDPEVFLVAAQRLGLAPSVCLVVEDAQAGIDAANAGGFDSCAIGAVAGYAAAKFSLAAFAELRELVEQAGSGRNGKAAG